MVSGTAGSNTGFSPIFIVAEMLPLLPQLSQTAPPNTKDWFMYTGILSYTGGGLPLWPHGMVLAMFKLFRSAVATFRGMLSNSTVVTLKLHQAYYMITDNMTGNFIYLAKDQASSMSNITERANFKVVIAGAFLLSMNAGYIGALSIAGLHHGTVAHVSGDVIKAGIYLSLQEWSFALRVTLVFVSYIVGSAISAVTVSATKAFDIQRSYGWALLMEALLLWISYLTSHPKEDGFWWSEYTAAMACGIQNALCTSYSGAIVRTTHMTGAATDIGLTLGQEIRMKLFLPFRIWLSQYRARQMYNSLEPSQIYVISDQEKSILWRLKVLIPLLTGYLLGALGGSLCYMQFKNRALLGPAVFIGIIGFFYVVGTTLRKTAEDVLSQIPPVAKKITVLFHQEDKNQIQMEPMVQKSVQT